MHHICLSYAYTMVERLEDNQILDIQIEDNDESKTETIMKEVQIHSSQSNAQFPSSYEKLTFHMTMPNPILTL
nr:hypothetical protein [Tanacetum cinerariifolium]